MQLMLDPAILFFVFGVLAGLLRSNLEIPPAIAKFLSLYLLMALGLKGGFALAKSGITADVALGLLAAVVMAVVVPTLGYRFLRRRISPFDAAAVAAAYGSVSAVTFVTATQVLQAQGIAVGGHMAVALVLMESPAILIGVMLAHVLRHAAGAPVQTAGGGAAALRPGGLQGAPLGRILHESFTDGAQLLLLGSLVVGILTGAAGEAVMKPFSGDLFKGMLAFFLLDMGLLVARSLPAVRSQSTILVLYAVLGPLTHAALALGLAALLRLPAGDAAMLMVLSASASYIVVPAVLREAVPEAQPSIYVGLSLGVTFPLNILLGIPLYSWAAVRVLG